jgi:hypothetical protein
MANENKKITIKYNSKKDEYSHSPDSTDIDLDDTITFVVKHGCCICFDPDTVFGRRLRLKKGTHGPYAPSGNTPPQQEVIFSITHIKSKCAPVAVKPGSRIKTYSIKVG